MQNIKKNDRISIYGNLNIQTISKMSEENISIKLKNKRLCILGDYLYDFLQKEYNKINYNFDGNNRRLNTTKIIINDKVIEPNSNIRICGYVEDNRGIPWEDGKKYDFERTMKLEDLFSVLENLYDDYIYEFDTFKTGLKIRIEEMKIE